MFISPPFLLPAPFVLRILGFQLCCRKSGVPREIYKISGKGAKRQKIGPTPPRSSQGLKDLHNRSQSVVDWSFRTSIRAFSSLFLLFNYPITKLLNYPISEGVPPSFTPSDPTHPNLAYTSAVPPQTHALSGSVSPVLISG